MTDTVSKKFSDDIVLHQGIIRKVCRIYAKDPAQREDLYQEIVLNAWRSYPNFEGRSKFSTWLYRVALNTAFYQHRKNKFFNNITGLDGAETIPLEESDKEQLEILYRAIGQLDAVEKSIVLLYLDELSYKEISEITGLTETNVGVKLNRIKTKMKKILQVYGT